MISKKHSETQKTSDHESTYLLFRVKDHIFSIQTTDVYKIQNADKAILPLPDTPDYVRGSFQTANGLFSVIDLRRLFEWGTKEQETHDFFEMIEARKRDHVNWVNELRKSHSQKTPFMLSKDCHRCALGVWRDNYDTKNLSIQHLFTRLDIPHSRLHELADDALKDGTHAIQVMKEVETDLMPQILAILDEMKTGFQEHIFRDMFILLQGDANIALVADEVLNIESAREISVCDASQMPVQNILIKNILQRTTDSVLVMELDIDNLITKLQHF